MPIHPYAASILGYTVDLVAVTDLAAVLDPAFPDSRVNLSWTDVSRGETGYEVYYKEQGVGFWDQDETLAGTTLPGAETYQVQGLAELKTWEFRVKAVHAPSQARAPWSNTPTATTESSTPAAPTGVVATAEEVDAIRLVWDAVSGAASYEYQWTETGFINWSDWINVGTSRNILVTDGANGLLVKTEYRFRVRAKSSGGNPGPSTDSNDETTLNLDNPTALTATGVNTPSNRIELSWTDNSNGEDTFRIERSPNGTDSWTEIDSVAAGVTTYNDPLNEGDEFWYRVRAQAVTPRGTYNGAYSGTATDSVPWTPPAAPTGLYVVSKTDTTVTLGWTDNSDNETGFALYYRETGLTWNLFGNVGPGVEQGTVSALTKYTDYEFKVAAFNPQYETDCVSPPLVSARTDYGTPDTPTNCLATSIAVDYIQVTWDSNNLSVDRFRIYRADTQFGTYTSIGTVGGTVESYDDLGLPTNTERWYKVVAESDSYGHSGFSNDSGATTKNLNAPTAFSVTDEGTSFITLGWQDQSNGEDKFEILRSSTETGTFTVRGTVNANIETYTDSGLGEGEKWWYKLRAYADPYDGGARRYSDEAGPISGTTDVSPPAAPTNLVATAVGSDRIDLTWTDNATNEDNYKVYRRKQPTITWTLVDTIAANSTSYSDTSLDASSTYDYYVAAVNTGGETDSNIDSATTTDGIPEVISASSVETTTGGIYQGRAEGTCDDDTLSVTVYVTEKENGFEYPEELVGTYDTTGGSNSFTSASYVSVQCNALKFRIVPYPNTGGTGTAGSAYNTTYTVLDNYGSDPC